MFPAPWARADGNRLRYLDELDPYFVNRSFARLATSQWASAPQPADGDSHSTTIDAVVVLAIDDMNGVEKWEQFLRPTLERLKRIDGRAPVSIMTNQVEPFEQHLQKWLDEGLSLEAHTWDHPCPLLKDGDLEKARATYNRCVDTLARVPRNTPVAFRLPYCDSLNVFSPRFVTEIFNRRTEAGNFLQIDSSVVHAFTADDPELLRSLTWDEQGRSRFRKYLPFPSFVNTIENYPYPYVLGGAMWEFPCIAPSDWEAQNLHRPFNPATVRDWQAALDATAIKGGTMTLVFHPHGWIRPEQINELIDYAVETYGRRVAFLTFREALERLNQNLLGGHPLRAVDGGDNGVRLVDLDDDGYLDVLVGNDQAQRTRLWRPDERRWREAALPVKFVQVDGRARRLTGVRLGIVDSAAGPRVTLLALDEKVRGAWQFDRGEWRRADELLNGLTLNGRPLQIRRAGRDLGVRLVDLDRDGSAELLAAGDAQRATFRWSAAGRSWNALPFALPRSASFVDAEGRDAGLRLVDVDDDSRLDALLSNEEREGAWLFESMQTGWATGLFDRPRGAVSALPKFVRGPIHNANGATRAANNGPTNNGAWFHGRSLWVQNEDTAGLPDLVERRAFGEILGNVPRPALGPEAALRSLKTPPGFRAELVAAEPLVADPIGFDFGPDGRLWVVEMGDYPDGVPDAEAPNASRATEPAPDRSALPRSDSVDAEVRSGSRVRVLEDLDGDGRMDRSRVFLDGLAHANSVLAWRDGVLVCAPPTIFFARDVDGDGRADERRTLYEGFGAWNPQHLANGLKRGLDNWIYGCNGDSVAVRSTLTGQVVDLANKDFRIRPDQGLIEPLTGHCQFIRNANDWGDWFGNVNNNPMWQYVIDNRYLKRNPHVEFPDMRPDVPESPGSARVFPASRTLERFNDLHTTDCFTSACCAIVYRDNVLGDALAGNSFVSEPVHNLVHREVVRREGICYRSRRAADELSSEFCASTDNFFRPTMIDTGLDGALWIADMYRRVIEHTEWIPDSVEAQLDVREGCDQGRIYRIVPVGAPLRLIPRLADHSAAEWVAALESPNGPQRDLAQQLLVHAADRTSIEPLRRLVESSPLPQARLHALSALDGLDALSEETLLTALGDEHAEVRRHAIRLIEPRLRKNGDEAPRLLAPLVGLRDDDPRVQLQQALALGETTEPSAGRALGDLAVRAQGDTWIAAAVWSSVLPHLGAVTDAIVSRLGEIRDPTGALAPLIASAMGTGDSSSLAKLFAAMGDGAPEGKRFADWQLEALADLLQQLAEMGRTWEEFRQTDDPALGDALSRLDGLIDFGRRSASDSSSSVPVRVRGIALLAAQPAALATDIALLGELLDPAESPPIQLAALDRLALLDDRRVADVLLERWGGFSPNFRREALARLLQRDAWIAALIDGLESGVVHPRDVDAARRRRLLEHDDPELSRRAAVLLGAASQGTRQQVLDAYRARLPRDGDKERGRAVFAKRCAACHRWQDAGHAVGPDLAALSDRSTEALLIAVLDPNRAVEARYQAYAAVTHAGQTYAGLLADDAGGAITLLDQENKRQTIQRSALATLKNSQTSLMPEGMEKDLSPQDLADLFALLQVAAMQPKTVAGNRPEAVRHERLRGELACLARHAEIFGPTLAMEEASGALASWSSEDDWAAWELDVEKPGRYNVLVEYACADDAAGGTYTVEAAGQSLSCRVESTQRWSVFEREDVGRLDLPAGRIRLTLRTDGALRGPLMNLKSVTLRPEGVD